MSSTQMTVPMCVCVCVCVSWVGTKTTNQKRYLGIAPLLENTRLVEITLENANRVRRLRREFNCYVEALKCSRDSSGMRAAIKY
jgi:hypothetical protein